MSLLVVARKDVRDAYRDRTLHALVVALAATGAGLGYAYSIHALGAVDPLPMVQFGGFLVAFVVAMVALATAHDVLPGDRRSGRLRLSMALPHSRRSMLLGTALGRATLVAVAALVGVGAKGAVAAARGVAVDPAALASYAGATALFGVAVSTAVVALSTLTRSGRRSVALGGAAVAVSLVWSVAAGAAWALLEGGSPPAWLDDARRLGPLSAFLEAAPLGTGSGDPVGIAVLLGWTAFALLAGAASFDRRDL